jgi:HEAT repeat protein
VRALNAIGTNALPHLLAMLESLDGRVRERSVSAFSILKEKGEPAIPQLARLGAQERTSNPAFHALVHIGIVTLPVLTNALSHADPEIRGRAASYIGMYGDKPESTRAAIPALTKCLTDPDAEVQFWAANTLSDITLEPSSLVPVLLSTLLQRTSPFRGESARDLGKLGVVARPAVPALLEAVNENDEHVEPQGAEALRRIEQAIDREKAESAQNKRPRTQKSGRKK